MATETTLQVSQFAEDVGGVSVVTASRNQGSPRSGAIYNPSTLASAVPIWFHPRRDGQHLAVFARRLTGATLAAKSSSGGSLLYSSASPDTSPYWGVLSPHTGTLSELKPVPSEQPGVRTLTAAFSRGGYLFLLNEYRTSPDAPDTQALLQNFHLTAQNGVELIGEEIVPLALRLGLHTDRRHLWVFGATPTGKMGMARKPWGRIGVQPDAGSVDGWQFWGRGRWTDVSDQISGLTDFFGAEIPADGPCSLARHRDTFYLAVTLATTRPATTVAAVTPPPGHTGTITEWTASSASLIPEKSWATKIYVSRKVDLAWKEHGFSFDLAASTTLYQGGAYLQEQLPLTPGYGVIVTEASVTTLDEFSDHTQVLTGTSPHTLVLPPFAAPIPAPVTDPPTPVSYRPYTVHNQSTADVVVMASSRDRAITVPHGVGLVFTPYIAEPLESKNWSWSYAAERAPRMRQGYPLVSTRRLADRDYQLSITGGPTKGTFRMIHNGQVTPNIVFDSTTPTATASAIRSALIGLDSISEVTVTAPTLTTFAISVGDDCAQLGLYAYRLVGGSTPQVALTNVATRSSWLTRWSVFEPNVRAAVPSGLAPAPSTPTTPTPPTALNPLLAQFTSVINVVTSGVMSVTNGVVSTVSLIISEAVRLITGNPVAQDQNVFGTVTDFLQNLARGGVSANSATSFENILRQVTGGTGRTETATTSPFQFVQTAISAAVDVVEDIFETLAEWFQNILNAILGR